MTTIIYKDKRLFVDSRAYSGDKTPIGSKNKLHFLEDGVYAGSSTVTGAPERLFELLRDGGVQAHVKEDLNVDAIYIQDNGCVYFFSNGPHWTIIDPDQHLALGSGAQYALGALECGADGYAAMAIACRLDVWTGLPIRSIALGESRE